MPYFIFLFMLSSFLADWLIFAVSTILILVLSPDVSRVCIGGILSIMPRSLFSKRSYENAPKYYDGGKANDPPVFHDAEFYTA